MLTPIRLTLTLAVINHTGSRAIRVLIALYALYLEAGPVTVGLLAAAFSALPMLISVPAGRLADRYGSRWMLTISATSAGLGILIPYFFPTLAALFIATALVGITFAAYNVSLQNLIGLLSDKETRAKNFINYSLTISVSGFVGPLIAGFSIDYFGYASACLGLALLTIVTVGLLLTRGAILPRATIQIERSDHSIRDLLRGPEVRKILVISSLLRSGGDLLQFYLPIYAHAIGLSASVIGTVLAMNAAAAFAVRTVLARVVKRYKEETVLVYAFIVGAVSVSLIPLFTSAVMLAILSFIFGLGMGCGQPLVKMMMHSNAPPGRSGEALGLRMTVNHVAGVVAPVLFGSLASVLGLASVFWANTLVFGAGAYYGRPKKDS